MSSPTHALVSNSKETRWFLKRDMKVERGFVGMRKRLSKNRKGTREGDGGEYD